MASDSNMRGGRKSMEVCESTEDVNVSNSFMWTEKIFHVDLKPPPHFLDVNSVFPLTYYPFSTP